MNSVRKTLWDAVARGRTKLPVTCKQRAVQAPVQLSDPRLVCEELSYQTETEGTQGWVPLRIVQAQRTEGCPKRPTVVFLHGTSEVTMHATYKLACVTQAASTRSTHLHPHRPSLFQPRTWRLC